MIYRKPIGAALVFFAWALLGVTQAMAQPKDAPKDTSKDTSKTATVAPSEPPANAQQLTAAYKKAPNPQILYQLGALAMAEGHLIEAQDLMRRYLAELAIDATTPAYKDAEQVVAKPRGPSGELDVLGDRGALVFVDDRLVGSLPLNLPLLLSAEEHVVLLERGRHRVKAPLKVLDGRGAVMRFNLGSNAVVVTQPPAIVILPELSVGASVSPRLQQTVEKSVRRANHAVFNSAVAIARVPEQRACLSTIECQVKLGQTNESDFVLTLHITGSGTPSKPDYQLLLKLLDVGFGDYSAQVEEKCAACDAEQIAAKLGAAADELLSKGIGRTHGTLTISSEPDGAEIHAGQQLLGTTPYSKPAWSGSQDLTLTLSGYQDEHLTVKVPEGEVGTFKVQLKPGSGSADSNPGLILGRPRTRFIAGAAVAGSGIIILTIGIFLLQSGLGCIDLVGDGSCDSSNNRAIAGGSLIGIGLLIGGAGGLMMGLPAKSK